MTGYQVTLSVQNLFNGVRSQQAALREPSLCRSLLVLGQPGPADGEWLYGHNWVCLALLMNHSSWGTIALPILSMLYIRQCDVAALNAKYGWEFLTKHQIALKRISRAVSVLRAFGSKAKTLVVFDGAYAARKIVDFGNGSWAAYFSTDANIDVRMILETVAERWAIEEFFHDNKHVWGAGQQQVRNVWSNIACWNINAWLYTMVEIESWDKEKTELVDRSSRPDLIHLAA